MARAARRCVLSSAKLSPFCRVCAVARARSGAARSLPCISCARGVLATPAVLLHLPHPAPADLLPGVRLFVDCSWLLAALMWLCAGGEARCQAGVGRGRGGGGRGRRRRGRTHPSAAAGQGRAGGAPAGRRQGWQREKGRDGGRWWRPRESGRRGKAGGWARRRSGRRQGGREEVRSIGMR